MTGIEQKLEQKLSASDIVPEIEKMVRNGGIGYIDAVIEYCEKNDLEVETISKIIKRDSVFKARIQNEAEDLNMIEKSVKLPI